MIVLIRNLTPIRISDVVPHSSDVSVGADLSRLKYYRNQVAHNDSGTLTDRQFQEWWNDIAQVMLELWLEKYNTGNLRIMSGMIYSNSNSKLYCH